MTDISTKKTIEVWENGDGIRYIVEQDDSYNLVSVTQVDNNDRRNTIAFSAVVVGQLTKAMSEVALSLAANTKEDDGD